MLLKGHHTTHVLSHSLSASSAHMLTPCQLKGPISQSVSAVLLGEVRSVIEQRVRNTHSLPSDMNPVTRLVIIAGLLITLGTNIFTK